MKTISAILMCLSLLWTTSVAAQPSARFPESRTIQLEGQRHEAFNLGGFAQLLQLDADLRALETEMSLQLARIDELTNIVEFYRSVDAQRLHQVQLLQDDRQRISTNYLRTNAELHDCETKPRLSGILGWVTTAVLAVSLGGVVLGVTLR